MVAVIGEVSERSRFQAVKLIFIEVLCSFALPLLCSSRYPT